VTWPRILAQIRGHLAVMVKFRLPTMADRRAGFVCYRCGNHAGADKKTRPALPTAIAKILAKFDLLKFD